MKMGVFYIATRRPAYLKQADRSARSLRKVWPKIHITICTELKTQKGIYNKTLRPPILTPNPFYDCVAALSLLPYDRTVVLDADTYIYEPFPEIFKALDKIDIMAMMSKNQNRYGKVVPQGFYELSTGILVIKKSPKMEKFLADWAATMKDGKRATRNDQEPFRQALYFHEDIRFGVLPDEYCFRPNIPCVIRGHVKIIHTNYRNKRANINYEHLGKKLNQKRNKQFLFYRDPDHITPWGSL